MLFRSEECWISVTAGTLSRQQAPTVRLSREFLASAFGQRLCVSLNAVRHTRIVVTHYGGPDALRVVEEDCCEPKRGEVRVRVLAAGVSLPDLMMREGIHPET